MARKKDKDIAVNDNDMERKGGSKLGTALLVFFIVLIWLGIFALLIKLDAGGIGSKILRPLLKDVPIINYILPDVSDEQLIYEQNYPYKNIAEAVEVIKELEKENELLRESNGAYPDQILDLMQEVERLKVFEDEQLAFEERVKDFDVNVVFNDQAPDIEEYRTYYEQINPETAEEIYRQVVEQAQYDEAIQKEADILKNMKPAAAAAVLQEMTADIGWICNVLLCMKTNECTEILNKMDTLFVARIMQKMQDMDQERLASIQNNLVQP